MSERTHDFVAIGLPNSNAFFETTFAVWKCGATPTSLLKADSQSCRLASTVIWR